MKEKKALSGVYDPDSIVDAPQFHGAANALGTLTAATWEHGARTFEERKRDFLFAYPNDAPGRFCGVGLEKKGDRYVAGTQADFLRRFESSDWRPGSLHELLSRYGLQMKNGPEPIARVVEPSEFLASAKKRNHRLRILHGGVDVEAKDMSAEKTAWLERQEKMSAAQQVRQARQRMRDEHKDLDKGRPGSG